MRKEDMKIGEKYDVYHHTNERFIATVTLRGFTGDNKAAIIEADNGMVETFALSCLRPKPKWDPYLTTLEAPFGEQDRVVQMKLFAAWLDGATIEMLSDPRRPRWDVVGAPGFAPQWRSGNTYRVKPEVCSTCGK